MKFSLSAAILALSVTGASAQGLFDIAPNDEATESSSKINYSAAIRVGQDDLINPGTLQAEQDSSYISASIGANAVTINNKTTTEFYVKYAANYHFDEVVGGDSHSNNLYGGLNYTRRINERLRFSSHNHVGYQLEADYEYGLANTRAIDEYWSWNSNNVFSYRLSELYSAQFGIQSDGVNYGSDRSDANRVGLGAFTQLRYQYSTKTVLTSTYRYKAMNNNSRPDSTSHYLTVGAEKRLSEVAVLVIRAGAQLYEIDTPNGDDSTNPYVEFAYRANTSERTEVRSFLRYAITDYDTSFGNQSFDKNENTRLGVAVKHSYTENLKFNAGLDVVLSERSDRRINGVPAGADLDDELVHAYVGFSYKLSNGVSVNGTYNHTQSSSDLAQSDYDRNRYSLGLSYTW